MFRLNQEELRLNFEAEIAKTAAKEQALAAIMEQCSTPLVSRLPLF